MTSLAACGSSDEDEIRAVVKEFQRSLDKRDAERSCALMTPRAEAQMTTFLGAFAGVSGCVNILRKTEPDDDAQVPGEIDKAEISIRDERALLSYGGDEQPVGLRKDDGEWRIDNLFNPSLDEQPRRADPRLTTGSDEQQVRATLAAMLDGFKDRDYERVCDIFSDAAEAQVLVGGAFVEGFGGNSEKQTTLPTCAQVLRKLEQLDEDGAFGDLPSRAKLDTADVSIRGDRATVKIPGEDPARLTKIDGRWLVEAEPTQSPEPAPTAAELERCWKDAGAEIASSADELSFASHEEAGHTALRPGRRSVKGDGWRIFYATPDGGDDPGLAKVLADPSSVPVVAYVADAPAHADVVAKARACGSD